jgi:catechol 2,3-dioxygenase-like lactoylglutathione lyase family enzyme
MTKPLALNHIGISVPDIHAAVAWYRDVLDCYVLVEPGYANNDSTHFGNVVKDIFGERFESVQMAHLTTADGTGLEFFQFEEPKNHAPADTFEYERHSIFHFCLTAPDIEEQAQRIADGGGKQLSKVWKLYPNKEYKAVYCQDPWGTVIELCTHPYSQFWSNLEPPTSFDA